jgi:hypothetical protein
VLQDEYSRAVQHFDWSVPDTVEKPVRRYIASYCTLRDEYRKEMSMTRETSILVPPTKRRIFMERSVLVDFSRQ